MKKIRDIGKILDRIDPVEVAKALDAEIWIGPGWGTIEERAPGEVIHKTRKGRGEIGRLIDRNRKRKKGNK